MAYSPVYSQPFIQDTPATGSASFEVPSGFTAVIRQISLSAALATGIFAVNIQDSEIAPAIAIHQETVTVLYSTTHVEGRWVVPEGGIISTYQEVEGDEFYVYIGGYLLRNVLT